MDFITGLFNAFGGIGLAYLGSAIAVAMCCVGSAKGTGMTGEAATGVIAETPEHFSKCMILQVLPGTQGLYGIVAWFMVLNKIGVFGGSIQQLTVEQGLAMFAACMPIAFGGLLSAIAHCNPSTSWPRSPRSPPRASSSAVSLSSTPFCLCWLPSCW